MRCARAAAHDRSPAAPGTPGRAPAGSSIWGSPPCSSRSRISLESALSVLARFLRPRAAAVSAGSARCACTPARASSAATYRHPVHASNANARIGDAFEPFQPGPQMPPVGRRDLTAHHLPGRQVDIVEGDLLPVDIHPAYDRHQGPPHAPRPIGRHTPHGAPVLGRSPYQAGPPGQLSRPQTGRSMSSLRVNPSVRIVSASSTSSVRSRVSYSIQRTTVANSPRVYSSMLLLCVAIGQRPIRPAGQRPAGLCGPAWLPIWPVVGSPGDSTLTL